MSRLQEVLQQVNEAAAKLRSRHFIVTAREVDDAGTTVVELSFGQRKGAEVSLGDTTLKDSRKFIQDELAKLDDVLEDMVDRIEAKIRG